jgi:hypothetical protein
MVTALKFPTKFSHHQSNFLSFLAKFAAKPGISSSVPRPGVTGQWCQVLRPNVVQVTMSHPHSGQRGQMRLEAPKTAAPVPLPQEV